MAEPSASRSIASKLPRVRTAPAWAARSRSHSSKGPRSTMPTKPPSIGMSTLASLGAIMRAQRMRATSRWSGIAKSLISRGGMAPPQGLMRPSRSSSSTLRPCRAISWAAVAPAGPPPITTAS